MNDMKETDEFLDEDEHLVLTYRGKDYSIPPVDAKTGLRIERIMSAADRAQRGADTEKDEKQVLSDADEMDLYPDVLGPVYDELLDDGVSFIRLRLAATAAMLWTISGDDVAHEYWEAGGKAPAPNRQQRRAKTTRTGGASSTRGQASGTGTSTRRKQSASQPKGKG
ncbi:MAG: hypothetical protein L0G94_07240 [Brachybacterium sp.]|uniref:DUF7426 family protein n=1 Tax=Brachybacterium sp. TaxID=1891286 RepID=UPI0026479BB4|nr:hypothetical protein [Brachybacterium sp.]MDN5686465.1 hypothetical protein [Brachybacterium sp.]